MASILITTSACADKANPASQVAQAPPPETVYVQQPVAPAPPPPPLAVSPRSVLFDAIGDTARLAIFEGTRCVAGSDAVARVDDAGLITAVSNGETHLRCWYEDRNASVRVRVAQALAHVAVVADEGLALRKAGDSVRLTLARVDRRNNPVEGVATSWTSLSPAVIRVDPVSGIAVGVADTGIARIVGQADGFADTVLVEVGAKAVASTLLSNTGRVGRSRAAAARANQRLTQQRLASNASIVNQSTTGGAPAVLNQNPIGARAPRASDSLFRDPTLGGLQSRRRSFVPWLTAGFGEHRIDKPVSAGGAGLEKSSGALFGGGLDVLTRGVLSFRFQFVTGTFTADSANVTSDRKVTDASMDVGLTIAPWLTVLAGPEARSYETTVDHERWLMLRVGGEASLSLGGGPLRGIARIFLLPLVSLQNTLGNPDSPSFGVQSQFGLGFENRRFSSSLTYDIERYSFASTAQRREQFGALLFRLGYKFGW